MDKVQALLLSQWRAAKSYRLRLSLSIAALAVSVLPAWYAASALQGLMGDKIRGEGTQYPAFLIVGMVVYSLLTVTVNALPTAISGGIANGSLEALLSTKVKIPSLFVGLFSYDLLWSLLRATIIVATGIMLGARFAGGLHALLAVGILGLTILAYFPFALLASASVLAFRTAGPLPQVVMVLSGIFGGVYFPTTVIPDLVRVASKFVPLSYGLRALRAVAFEGKSLAFVSNDIATLLAMTMLFFAVALVVLAATLRHVRHGGGLSQY